MLPHLALSAGWAAAIGHSLWLSLYILWIGLLFAAAYGTGKTLPIAGAGLTAKAWQETTARVLISIGSILSASAVLATLSQWHWTP